MRKHWHRVAAFILALVFASLPCNAQVEKMKSANGEKFPYSFTNFVWWNESDLRAILKLRIPGLSDEIGRDSTGETRIRSTLIQLLREKGIAAEVQTTEPSVDSHLQIRDPDAPPQSIAFTIASPPKIALGGLTFENAPAETLASLNALMANWQGRSYNSNAFWNSKSQIRQSLYSKGYLEATLELEPLKPAKDGDQYVVPVIARVVPGPQFHISSIRADGGPLVKGKDLSPYFSQNPGDVAVPNPFGRLAGLLRAVYWRAGFPDVAFQGEPVLDISQALASYQLEVIPGPLYHLRSLSVENLDAGLEQQIHDLLGLAPGDVYDALAVASLSQTMVRSIPA